MPERVIEQKYWFHMKDGRSISSITDLAKEYKKNVDEGMSENFNYHLINNGNDFASWISSVFNLKDLAEEIRTAATPGIALTTLENYISSRHEKKKMILPTSAEEDEVRDNIKKLERSSEEKLEKVQNMKKRIIDYKKNIPEQVEELHEEYNLVYNDISDLRRSGKDVFIPALRMKNVKAKIDYLRVSKKSDDYNRIKSIFRIIRNELEECRNYNPPDLAKEILEEADKVMSKDS